MAATNRFRLALVALGFWASTGSAAQLPIHDIQIFNAELPRSLTNRGDEDGAIDNNPGTYSYLTPSGSTGIRYAGLDLGGTVNINRFQVNKFSADIDGVGEAFDPMDLQILYTTDTGPLIERNYVPVTGLTNGYLGGELITANSVNAADATVLYDTHGPGIYSLSFDSVAATGLAMRFQRNEVRDTPWIHYPSHELTPMLNNSVVPVVDIDIFSPVLPTGTVSFNREDRLNSIDGNPETFSYLTQSGTGNPAIAALELGNGVTVERLRVAKSNEISGFALVEPMNIQVLYTTDAGPLNERTYQPVTGLTSGFEGAELINALSVNSADATVLDEIHHFPTDGYYSLSFDAVNATAIAIRFEKPDGAAFSFVHYPTYEFEAYGEAAPVQPGDFNGDGNVDGADFVIWQTNFPNNSGSANLAMGDANGDGNVDGADFVIWQTNFPFIGSSVTTVPEPCSMMLVVIGVAAFTLRRGLRAPGCNV